MGLRRYIVRRIADSIIVVALIFLLNFFLFYRALPGISELSIIDQLTSYLHFVFIDGFRTTSYAVDLIPGIIGNLPFTVCLWGVSIAAAIMLSIVLGAIVAYKFKSTSTSF